MARPTYEKMRKALMRSNTRLLLTGVVLFQFAAMLLVSFRGGSLDTTKLLAAVALPLGTLLITNLMPRLWPVDRAIVILVMMLSGVGIITLYDIARVNTTPNQQMLYLAAGMVAMIIGAWGIRRLRHPKKWIRWLMPLGLLALAAPWVVGSWHQGARNWISFMGISLQPSEFVKPLLIVVLAAGLSGRPHFKNCLLPLGYAALCCGVLLSERDLGALLLFFLTTVLMYYAATSNLIVTLGGLTAGGVCAVVAYNMFDYVKDRVAIWIDPWSDAQDTGYQLVQSLIAIGSGGLTGAGLGLGRPRTIPLYYSDFIFAAIAEEFGLVFSVCLLALYVLLIMRGMIVAMNARSSFHSLTALGIVIMMGLQTMLIVGGNTKLLPLTGVTLPFISAGGSSLVSMFLEMGILLGISAMNAEDEAHDIEKRFMREEDFA